MGPLQGVRIIEMAGIGPGPFCAMMLADMGAEVLRIDRKNAPSMSGKYDVMARGRKSVAVDLKQPAGVQTVLRLLEQADGLLEGYRPGVMERLGLGPEACHERNPRLVYGRMTGWGQVGPLAHAAGHDINYIAISGALAAIGRPGERPVPPLNLIGDFGGGGMLLAFGMVCALLEAQRSGKGQVVDAAMTDGAALLMAMMYGFHAGGMWKTDKGTNLLDGGAHFYDTYETADGKYVAVGAIEPKFYHEMLTRAGLDAVPEFKAQMNQRQWPALKARLAEAIRRRSRAEWAEIMEGSDACFMPILDMDEAPAHPHNRERGTFTEIDGVIQPAPAPRFSRTPPQVQGPPPKVGEHSEVALQAWGFSDAEVAELRDQSVV